MASREGQHARSARRGHQVKGGTRSAGRGGVWHHRKGSTHVVQDEVGCGNHKRAYGVGSGNSVRHVHHVSRSAAETTLTMFGTLRQRGKRIVVEVEPTVAAPVKGWVSGNAGLHAGNPAPDPSRVDKSLGGIVFRRGGLAGSAEARLPAAAAGSSVISHPGFIQIVFLCGEAPHALCYNKTDDQKGRHYTNTGRNN